MQDQSNRPSNRPALTALPEPRSSPEETSDLAGYLVGLRTGVSVPPWSDFIEAVTYAAYGSKGFVTRRGGRRLEPVELWQRSRGSVLATLADLGLAATVRRTDQDVPLGEHHADLAGLVVVHEPGRPAARYVPEVTEGLEADYRARMLTVHGLRPHRGYPDTPRAFVGQSVTHSASGGLCSIEARPSWWDKVRTWTDAWQTPTLTVETCAGRLAAPLPRPGRRDFVHRDPIPIRWEVHEPLWRPGADGALFMIQWDAEAEVPAAESTPRRRWLDLTGTVDDADPHGGTTESFVRWLTPDEWTAAEVAEMRRWAA